MNPLDREFIEEIVDLATEQVIDVLQSMTDLMVRDGLAYGDVPFEDDADFAAYYLDLERRGVLRFLPTVAPKFASKLETRMRQAERKLLEVA